MTQQTLPTYKRKGKKNKLITDISSNDMYKFYVSKYGTSSKTGVTYSKFCKIINDYNLFMVDKIIRGDRVHLPKGIGYLEVIKRKQRFVIDHDTNKPLHGTMLVDWKATREYWKKNPKTYEESKVIFHTNEHTNGYRFKLRWEKTGCKILQIYMYSLLPSRKFKNKLTAYLKDPESQLNFTERC